MKMLCSRVTLAQAPHSSVPCLPACGPQEDTNLQYCGCPHFKGGNTEALKAKCWSQDRRTHLCLVSQLMTPNSEPQ